MLHRLIALPIATLAALVLVSVTLAGGWAQVTLTHGPVEPVAGDETPIKLSVLQHGRTAVSWPHVGVIATHDESGAVVRADARAEGPEGSYVATIVFPSGGPWTFAFESPELQLDGIASVNVAAAPLAAAAAAPAGAELELMPLLLLIIVGGTAVVGIALFARSRHGAPHARVPASS